MSRADLASIVGAAASAFPDVRAKNDIVLVGEGFSSFALSLDGSVIIRVARNAEALARHQREWAILHELRPHLPLAIPAPRWRLDPTEDFPFGLIGYPILAGTPWKLDITPCIDLAHVAQQIGEFMSALHAFPVRDAFAAGVLADEAPAQLISEVLPALRTYLDVQSHARFVAWWASYPAHPDAYAYRPRLLHGDLWCENILLAEDLSQAVGVVDFEQVRVGDPVAEFAALRYLGDEFIDCVRAHYHPADNLEPHFEERLRAAIILRELGGLRYALCYPDSGELPDAVDKVREVLRNSV